MMINSFRALLGVAASVLLASTAAANVVNPSFEDPALAGGDFQCLAGSCPGWSDFGAAFIVDDSALGAGYPGAVDGDQVLKVFGGTSGVFQQFAASPGQTWAASVSALNTTADPLSGGQIGAMNIEWIAADGMTNLGTVFGSTIDASTTLDVWQLLTASGMAPAGTAFARLVLITGNFGGDPAGGAAFFDAASLKVVPIPAAVWLMASGLLGLIGLRRRKA